VDNEEGHFAEPTDFFEVLTESKPEEALNSTAIFEHIQLIDRASLNQAQAIFDDTAIDITTP